MISTTWWEAKPKNKSINTDRNSNKTMKLKYIGSLFMTLAVLFSCDDNTGELGMSMLDPESDYMSAHTVSFPVTTRSIKADSMVYAKTSTGYVGRFSDPEFGTFESSFLTALTCTENFSLPAVYHETTDENGNTIGQGIMAEDKVTSARLVVFYSSWFGDSINACRMSAYELKNGVLDYDDRYTYHKPEEYYNPQKPLATPVAFSAYDTTVPDSVRNGTDSSGNPTYSPSVIFKLDNEEYDRRIRQRYREDPAAFANSDVFQKEVFPGLCLVMDQGDGTILYVDRVDLQLQFKFFYVNDSTGLKLQKKDGTDSTYYSMQTVFSSTKEVTQLNSFANTDKLKEKAEETDWTYLKSPAGIFTEATLPYDEIYGQLANDTLNGAKLTFTNYRQESKYDFSMDAPNEVILIRKKDLGSFFENNEITDNITSYASTHNSSGTNQYTFSNIARLITTCINEKKQAREAAGSSWDEEKWMQENPDWNKVLLIPVSITYDRSSSSSNTVRIIGIQHDLQPGYAKLKGGATGDVLQLEVTYTSFQPEQTK